MRLLLDMDGVLVNIVAGFGRLYPIPNPYPATYSLSEAFGVDEEEIWSHANRDFWANLPKSPYFEEILNLAGTLVGLENTFICSSPHKNPESAAGKIDWINKYMPDFAKRRAYNLTALKWLAANPFTVLVDDHQENCTDFVKWGGRAILFPAPWNALANTQDPMAYLYRELSKAAFGYRIDEC